MLDLAALAAERFGFSSLLPGQREVMDHLVAGRSAAAIFPTGGGKSLCYQLPALLFEGITLVVSPLIALMKDQIDVLRARGVVAHRLDSTLTVAEYREIMADVRSGRARLLYVAPERFNNERFRQMLQVLRVSLFAVDEAHCISEWGHNFRPDYLKLAGFARACRAERRLALTATAPPRVAADIANGFGIEPRCVVRTGFYRKNLTLLLTPAEAGTQEQRLLAALAARPRGATVVYVSQQKTAERVAQRLTEVGFAAWAYHAGLEDSVRAEVQDRFLAGSDGVVVATIAFGMGIDKSDIRYVYHYNLPKSLENLAQEIGRAGRDGAEAICEVFVCPDDVTVLENFAYGDTPSAASVASLVQDVVLGDDDLELSLHALSRKHDIRLLVLRTLLTYLELDQVLEGGTPLYSSYRFKPLTTSQEMLASVEGERRQFLRGVLKAATKKRTWFALDVEAAAETTGSGRDRVVRALDWLAEKGHIELEPQGVRHRYRRLRVPDDLDAYIQTLAARTRSRERAELDRIRQVLDLTTLDRCQVRALGRHFGDPEAEPCGHCSHCLHGPSAPLVRTTVRAEPAAVRAAFELCAQYPEALGNPRALARLLCGLTSPALAAAHLTRHEHFGVLSAVPFPDVLALVEGSATTR
ncbi:MAG: RecQ family ATP-dependent DNA helicase [Polyangiaceae bacterium]|nr:RecQ family ATP-dependent DNA helicase [Polyangiaceae bacterium]